MTETIQQLKKDISILQEKLQKLEAQEPEMTLMRQGKVDFVDYDGKDGKKYIRIEYTDSFADGYHWYVRRVGEDSIRPVRDVNVYAPLEELYQKEVMKQKEEYPYKKYTPEETAQSLKEAFVKAQKTEKWRELRKKIDKPAEGIYDNIDMDKMVEKLKENPPEFLKFELGKTLEEVCMRWWDDIFSINSSWDSETSINDLCDRIFLWLPKEQNSSGSQNAYTEVAVEAHNELLKKIKSKIHNKK